MDRIRLAKMPKCWLWLLLVVGCWLLAVGCWLLVVVVFVASVILFSKLKVIFQKSKACVANLAFRGVVSMAP